MRFDHIKSLSLSAVLFLGLLAGGLLLSEHKLLWNDELFTQHTAIDGNSYVGILALKFPDGNRNPLFYLLQKAVCDGFSYHMPTAYTQELNRTRDISAETILRIPSNIYMSLSLAVIFYFFTRFFSWWAGAYALAVALASPMVWMYWVEARPYSLWFLLTTVQLLLFAHAVISPQAKTVRNIFVTHVLLALTTPASMMQITIVPLMLWWKARYNLKQLALIWILPISLAFFYYSFAQTSKIKTYMFATNLFDVIMPEHLFIYIVYAVVAWVLPPKYKKISWNIFFLPAFLLFFASGFLVLFVDLFTLNSHQGFFSRYLIYMTPADVLMFSLASFDLRQWSRAYPWICMNVSIFLVGLVIVRGLMTYRDILALALYLHS